LVVLPVRRATKYKGLRVARGAANTDGKVGAPERRVVLELEIADSGKPIADRSEGS
jgi:hypothetical protein